MLWKRMELVSWDGLPWASLRIQTHWRQSWKPMAQEGAPGMATNRVARRHIANISHAACACACPKWSADDAKRGQYHKPSTDELCSQKKFRSQLDVKGSLVLRLNGDAGAKSCFAFGQKTKVGPLHKISLKTARAAAALWEQGPPTSMALRDFKVMASVLCTTADACSLCWT